MKTTLFTVALVLASHFSNSQRIFEATNGSWINQNLSVETFQDFVVSGFTEKNPTTGLLTPTFKISNSSGTPMNTYYVDYPDAVYLMDFTIREATHTIVLAGMTAVTTGGTPYKMIVAEVDLMTGTPVQSSLEYTSNGNNSMIPHQVILSEPKGQVTVVGTEIMGTLTSSNFASIPKFGFVLGLDINNFNTLLYAPIEMNLPGTSSGDYDMLENITEVNGSGYFISGSCNGPTGEQNLLIMQTDYSGVVTYSRIIDNTNFRFVGSSVMYYQPQNWVYILVNNSVVHQFQVAAFNLNTGVLGPWFRHQLTGYPIGSGVDQNGFRLQQSNNNFIVVGGYLSAPTGALPQRLTPFQITMKDNLNFLAAKVYQSGNNSPLSPSYFEESGNSVFINTPDMIAYNSHTDRTYLVNQNTINGGFDLNVSSLLQPSKCEKSVPVTTYTDNPIIVGTGNFNPLPMYAVTYMPTPGFRPISERILCQSVAPTAIAVVNSSAVLAPNPAADQLSITLEEETIQSVLVYDMKGNLVLSQKGTERTSNAMTLWVGKLNQGAYMVEITTKEGTIQHERFVKE
jgi:hypothetical protein